MACRTRVIALGLAAIALTLAACQPVKKTPPPPPPALTEPPPGSPTLVQDLVLSQLNTPWDIAFVPGTDTLLFTEKLAGTLSRINESDQKEVIGSVPVHAVSATGSDEVEAQHAGHMETGLMGVAVHPNFPTNPWIYLCFTTENDVRVQRHVLDTTAPHWSLDPPGTPSQPVLTGITFGLIHNGCRIRFQPGTNHLFITTGDALTGTTPQSPTALSGKVLRVDANLAPVAATVPGFDPRVYTFGHRNVQGLAFGPGGVPYVSEHGPDRNDEVNRLVPGGNSGWDPMPPPHNDTVPMTDLFKFPGAMLPVWRSGDFGTIAPSGAAFLDGPQWGSWQGALAVAFLKGRQLMIMFLNPDGTVKYTWSELKIAEQMVNGQPRSPRLRGVTLGPDSNLYIATDAPVAAQGDNFPGEIWKITPTAP